MLSAADDSAPVCLLRAPPELFPRLLDAPPPRSGSWFPRNQYASGASPGSSDSSGVSAQKWRLFMAHGSWPITSSGRGAELRVTACGLLHSAVLPCWSAHARAPREEPPPPRRPPFMEERHGGRDERNESVGLMSRLTARKARRPTCKLWPAFSQLRPSKELRTALEWAPPLLDEAALAR